MGKDNVIELAGRVESADLLTELLRSGARQLLQQAIEAEVQELLAAHSGRTLGDGRAGVVRNGHQPERDVQTGIGPVTVRIPKVRARTGEPVTFRSALVPPYVRKTRSLEAALPWLYLCQWQLKTAHFWQFDIAHFSGRTASGFALVPA